MEPIGIVLVDDYPNLQDIAQRFLQQQRGFQIIGATTHKDALAVIEQKQPQVVIMDLGISNPDVMPNLARLHARMPGLHIIALTLFDEDCYRQAALEAGAEALLTKEYLYSELVPCIHRVVKA